MIINLVLIWICFNNENKKGRKTFCQSVIAWASIIYVEVLLLSLLHSLNIYTVIGTYILVNGGMVCYLNTHRDKYICSVKIAKNILDKYIIGFKKDRLALILGVMLVLYICGVGVIAALAVPYGYDALSYHAPRVHQWVQNNSVLYYASHVTRQNTSTVLASYLSTYLFILLGEYHGALCWIQYVAYVINLILIISVCNYYNINLRLQLLAGYLWVTLPIGFAEAITPQNDLLAATWVLVFYILIQDMIDHMGDEMTQVEVCKRILWLALGIALGYLTKPAVCFAYVIMLFWYLCECIIHKYSIRFIVQQCIIACGIIFIMICPQMIQNYFAINSAMTYDVGFKQLIGTLRPRYVILNFLKNISYGFVFSINGFSNKDNIINTMYTLAKFLDVDLDSIWISESAASFCFASLPNYTCDAAINLNISVLSLVCGIMYLKNRKRIENKERIIIRVAYISFILFNVVLRWEKSITRYMIGYYALLVIADILVLSKLYFEKKQLIRVIIMISTVLIIIDMGYEMWNTVKLHPIIPVKSSMTMYNYAIYDYEEICEEINNSDTKELGLIDYEVAIEYPIYLMLRNDIKIRHVNLKDNIMCSEYERTDIVPDMVLALIDCGSEIECHGRVYQLSNSNSYLYLYK